MLSGVYPAGKIAFVGKKCEELSLCASALPSDYKVYFYTGCEIEKIVLPEDVRFAVGFLPPSAASFLRKTAGDRKYAFCPTQFDFRYLYPFDKTEGLPEFVYLDKNLFSCENPSVCAQFYAQIFTFYCEGKIRLLAESHLPFKNVILESLTAQCENLLGGAGEKEKFLTEGARLMQVMAEEFPKREFLYTGSLADRYGLSPERQFVASYFLTVFLINFTNRPFHDILINTTEKDFRYDPSVLPDKQKLKTFATKMKMLTDLPPVRTNELIGLLSEISSELPLLSSLAQKGVFEGLNAYEKFTRH